MILIKIIVVWVIVAHVIAFALRVLARHLDRKTARLEAETTEIWRRILGRWWMN